MATEKYTIMLACLYATGKVDIFHDPWASEVEALREEMRLKEQKVQEATKYVATGASLFELSPNWDKPVSWLVLK